MKLHVFTAFLAVIVGSSGAQEPQKFKDEKEKLSYSLGINIGNVWKQRGVEADPDTVARGIKDALAGQALLTEQEVREITMAYQKELNQKQEEKRKQLGAQNQKEGEEFLAKNKTQPGVITLPSGLQYKVITEGNGPKPQATNRVTVNYRGTLIDGTEFDSSYKRGQPATFEVGRVIKGWQEALQLMPVGSKWQLFIPSELAYREAGSGPNIGPNAVLLFDVELISIAQPTPPRPAAAAVTTGQPVTSDIIKVPSAEGLKRGEKIEVLKPEDVERELQKQEKK